MDYKDLQEIKERYSKEYINAEYQLQLDSRMIGDIGKLIEEAERLAAQSEEWRNAYIKMKEQWKHDCDLLVKSGNEIIILKAEIERLREQNRWISVEERLPKIDTNCLVTTEKGEIFTSKFYGYGEESQGFKEFPEGVWEIDACEEIVVAWRELEPYKGD